MYYSVNSSAEVEHLSVGVAPREQLADGVHGAVGEQFEQSHGSAIQLINDLLIADQKDGQLTYPPRW